MEIRNFVIIAHIYPVRDLAGSFLAKECKVKPLSLSFSRI